MTNEPTKEEVLAVLRKLQELQALRPLSEIVSLSKRTLERHAAADAERPEMGGATYLELAELFVELDLIGHEDDFPTVARAVKEIRRRATLAADAEVVRRAGPNGDGGEQGGVA